MLRLVLALLLAAVLLPACSSEDDKATQDQHSEQLAQQRRTQLDKIERVVGQIEEYRQSLAALAPQLTPGRAPKDASACAARTTKDTVWLNQLALDALSAKPHDRPWEQRFIYLGSAELDRMRRFLHDHQRAAGRRDEQTVESQREADWDTYLRVAGRDADELASRIERLAKATTLVVLAYDQLERPKVVDPQTYQGGSVEGRAVVLDLNQRKPLCQAPFEATSSRAVQVQWSDQLDADLHVNAAKAAFAALGSLAPGIEAPSIPRAQPK